MSEVPGPYNLVEMYEVAMKRWVGRPLYGTKNAAGTGYDWITYEAFDARVKDLRAGLSKLGIEKGDGVAIIANNSVEWAVACYATYGLGGRFVPMYEAELRRVWKYIIKDSGVKALFVSTSEVKEQVADFLDEIETLEHILVIEGEGRGTMAALEAEGREAPVDAVIPDDDDIAGLIYTSGTTASPKGVLLSHKNLATNVTGIIHAVEGIADKDDRSLSFLPWAHSFGQITEVHVLINLGACAGFAEGPTTVVEDIGMVKPTLLFAVPRVFNKIHDGIQKTMNKKGGLAKILFDMVRAASQAHREGRAGLVDKLTLTLGEKLVYSKIRDKLGGELRISVSSSAALNPTVMDFFDDIGVTIYEAWGLTELAPCHTANSPSGRRRSSVGRSLIGCRVEIDKTLTGEDSKDGEIIAYGPNVMKGYHNQPWETAKVLRKDGGLHTGDRGWVDEDGFLYITGRIKEQYKLENGKYVFPSGIEETIKLSLFVENVMLYGANKRFNVALVVPDMAVLVPWAKAQGLGVDPATLVTLPAVEAHLMVEIEAKCTELARYERPRRLLVVAEPFTPESGILTPTLKLKRRVVVERFGERLDALYE